MDRSYIYNTLTKNKKDVIYKHLSLVLNRNNVLNLTAIKDIKAAKILHIEDSLCALPEINEAQRGLYIDIGSGGGFPGIPLAVASGRNTILVESIKKKAQSLKDFCKDLNLSQQVKVEAKRIEELEDKYNENAVLVTARALSSIPSLLELASPLLKITGKLILYKSDSYFNELGRGNRIVSKLGFSFPTIINYKLSDGSPRSLIIYTKLKKAAIKIPRRIGMAQKKPLA